VCKERLNLVLINNFRKDKMFTDMLFEIWENETKQVVFEEANLVRKKRVSATESLATKDQDK